MQEKERSEKKAAQPPENFDFMFESKKRER